jgi:2-alkyl-3-oxoalkanoate reductase
MKHVLVTGASGFVGRNITRALVNAGYRVKAQYRREKPPEELLKAARGGAELIRADLIDIMAKDSASMLVDGVDGIVHTAAKVSPTGPRRGFDVINVDVTKWLQESAAGMGCRRFVYLSSTAVQGFGEHFSSSESGPYFKMVSNYQRSKKAAENIVAAFEHHTMATTVLRPGFVYGPGDTKILKLVFDLLASGRLPMIGGFDVYNCFLYVDDLMQAVMLALESPQAAGEVFNITGDDVVTLREAVFAAAGLMGKPEPRINIPAWLAKAAGAFVGFIYTFLRISGDAIISPYLMHQLSSNYHFSSDKAKKLLGFAPRVDWQEGLKKSMDAYRKENPGKFH